MEDDVRVAIEFVHVVFEVGERDETCAGYAGDPSSPNDPDGSRADIGAYPYGYEYPASSGSGPLAFALAQNAPNPFNPSTTIRFAVPAAGRAELAIYDIAGRQVRTLFSGYVAAGAHEATWDGRDESRREVASGIFVYRLNAVEGTIARRMVIVR